MALEDLYNRVMSSRDTMAEFVKASGTDTLSEFAGKHGCAASKDEIRKFFIAKCEGELPDDAVDEVSGGAFDLGKLIYAVFNSRERNG